MGVDIVKTVQVRLKMMREKSWSKDVIIAELEKIKVVSASDGKRLMNPITKTQRLIFEPFALSEDDLRAHVTVTPDAILYVLKVGRNLGSILTTKFTLDAASKSAVKNAPRARGTQKHNDLYPRPRTQHFSGF